LIAGLAMMVSGASCRESSTWDDPGPKATFRQYLMHWFHGESREAFEMIAPDDRERLTRPLDVLRERLDDGALPEEHEMLIAGRIDNPYDIKSMQASPTLESRPEPGTKVTLELEYHDQRTGRADVVWRDGQWYVDLPLAVSSTESDDTTSSDVSGESPERDSTADVGRSDAAASPSPPDTGEANAE
jgi:hypothetical protein